MANASGLPGSTPSISVVRVLPSVLTPSCGAGFFDPEYHPAGGFPPSLTSRINLATIERLGTIVAAKAREAVRSHFRKQEAANSRMIIERLTIAVIVFVSPFMFFTEDEDLHTTQYLGFVVPLAILMLIVAVSTCRPESINYRSCDSFPLWWVAPVLAIALAIISVFYCILKGADTAGVICMLLLLFVVVIGAPAYFVFMERRLRNIKRKLFIAMCKSLAETCSDINSAFLHEKGVHLTYRYTEKFVGFRATAFETRFVRETNVWFEFQTFDPTTYPVAKALHNEPVPVIRAHEYDTLSGVVPAAVMPQYPGVQAPQAALWPPAPPASAGMLQQHRHQHLPAAVRMAMPTRVPAPSVSSGAPPSPRSTSGDTALSVANPVANRRVSAPRAEPVTPRSNDD